MARRKIGSPGGLTPEQARRKAHLEQVVREYNIRSQTGTCYHEELERLRQLEAASQIEAVEEAAEEVEEKDNDRSSS